MQLPADEDPAPVAIGRAVSPVDLVRYIHLKLAALGQPVPGSIDDPDFLDIARPLLRNFHQKDLMLGGYLCPADQRIQAFLDSYLSDVSPQGAARLPAGVFVLDRPGLRACYRCRPARILSRLHI